MLCEAKRQINAIEFLFESYGRLHDEKDKAINTDKADFLNYVREIIVNYTATVITNPDLFTNHVPQNGSEGIALSGFRLF